jgi:hypothetical protein
MKSKLVPYVRDAVETISPLEMIQLQRLRAGIERISRTVPFYAARMKEAGIDGKSIRSLDDLDKLPFTTKSDLRDNYPFGLLAVPMKEIVRIHASSGTTGKPGLGRAKWMVLSGENIDGRRAFEIGLVDHLVKGHIVKDEIRGFRPDVSMLQSRASAKSI